MREEPKAARPKHAAHRKKGPARWILLALVIFVVLVMGGVLGFQWLKVRRANKFATARDSFRGANNLNDAAVQYRVALQLDPNNYQALSGAARLASQVDRPEAIELWQKVIELRKSTLQDREDYAELLIKNNRLALAEKILDPLLLKGNPDTRTLRLASRYSVKMGEDAKALDFMRIASKRAPEDDATRFQLAELLAQSTNPSEQSDAR